jgi:hypothetical protein
MFYDQLVTAIGSAGRSQLDDLSRQVSRALGAGSLADDRAQQLYELIELRREPVVRGLPPTALAGPPKGYFIRRSPDQRSPDRAASSARRRRLALSGLMPPHLGARFTFGELAVFKIVADEFLAHGICDLSQNEIGSRAGVSRVTAKRALLRANSEKIGLISVERRPRSGRKHLTNIIRIVDAEWLTWLALGNRKERAIRSCNKAKPDFKPFRGVKNDPPRAQVLRNSSSEPVDKSGEKLNRTAADRRRLYF